MIKPLKICFVTSRFFPDHGGGALQALHICQKLISKGHHAFVITGHNKNFIKRETLQEIQVVRFPIIQQTGYLRYYLNLANHLLANKNQFDVLHIEAIRHHAYVAGLVGKSLKKPVIVRATNMFETPEYIQRRRLGYLQSRMLLQFTRILTLNHEMYAGYLKSGFTSDKVILMPNGTDTNHFRPANKQEKMILRKTLELPENKILITFVGAVRYVKGVDILADAWAEIKQAVPNAQANILGSYQEKDYWGIDPNYVRELEHKFQENSGMEKCVAFLGNVDNVRDYLAASDIFVMPSRSEGQGIALMEAMACGLPFTGTDLGVFREMAPKEQYPFLFPSENAHILAEKVIKLAQDEKLRNQLGYNNRQSIINNYSLEASVERLENLYLDLTKHQLGRN